MMNVRITHYRNQCFEQIVFETATASDEPEYWLGGFNLRRLLHEY